MDRVASEDNAPPVSLEAAPDELVPTATRPAKVVLLEWCAKRGLTAPTFEGGPVPEGFAFAVRVVVHEGTTLASVVCVNRSIKLAQNDACADAVAQIATRTDLPAARPPKPEKKKNKKAPPVVMNAGAVAAAAARRLEDAKTDARAMHIIAQEQARTARIGRARALLQTTRAEDAQRVLGEFRDVFGVRHMAVEAKPQRGRAWSISARLERNSGAQVHVQPFVASSREEGIRVAYGRLLQAIAASQGIRRPI